MVELIGDELEEDELFWSDQRWQEAADDDDFVDSGAEGGDGSSDEADSDFDAPEVEDEAAVTEEAVVAAEKAQQRQERKQRNAYVDPALKRRREEKQKKLKQLQQKQQQQKAKQETEEKKNDEEQEEDEEEKEEAAARRPKRRNTRTSAGNSELKRSLRESTVSRSLEDEQKRQRREAEIELKRSRRRSRRAAQEPPQHMTQEQKMAEAVLTEERNKRELEELLAAFQAQKSRAHRIERVYGAGPVTILSRLADGSDGSGGGRVDQTTVIFKEDSQVPRFMVESVKEPPCLYTSMNITQDTTHNTHA